MTIINVALIFFGLIFLVRGGLKSLAIIRNCPDKFKRRINLIRAGLICCFAAFYLLSIFALGFGEENAILNFFAWTFALGGVFVWLSFVDLSSQEKTWDTIVKSAPDIILTLSNSGEILYANKGIQNDTTDSLIGSNILELIIQNQRADVESALLKVREELKPQSITTHLIAGEALNQSLAYQLRINLLNQEKPQGPIVISLSDLSEQLALESQLRQAQKMDSIGRLAGGVAHDFNNLLTVIGSSAELLHESASEKGFPTDKIDLILESYTRAKAVTAQLLAFSRQQTSLVTKVNVNEEIAKIKTTLLPLLGENISFSFSPSSLSGHIKADKEHLFQIILNLGINARDAMPKGGEVKISTSIVRAGDDISQADLEGQKGSFVLIVVSDNGVGMDTATQSKIFEPFFTTKKIGHGTGLGLSTVYGVVKKNQGQIFVQSELGQGTQFRIYFPLESGKPSSETSTKRHTQPKVLKGTILLVEDEENVRKITKSILIKRGFQVVEASDGKEGLSRFEENSHGINLVLTDVVMPNMDGQELSQSIAKRDKKVPILFMSGYTANFLVEKNGIAKSAKVLSKPFSSLSLIEEVTQAMN